MVDMSPMKFIAGGHSNDGTTKYLDELSRLYPDNITVYRKQGCFLGWKTRMVNAPLANINEECLHGRWMQMNCGQLSRFYCSKNVHQQPDKTAAFYWCFVGENLVISTVTVMPRILNKSGYELEI